MFNNNKMVNIKDLSDYPAIKKLASALHQFDANRHGAAIMIGAGFSRSAAKHVGGEKKMPLWYGFSKRLLEELNPGITNLSFSDPLRIAEEYRAYFGQAALNDQIRFEIDDDAWRASDLYNSLLKLPWSEIMTTNWDTLLERAAKDVHSPYYTPVTQPSDLAWAPSPRIVKFHGTIGMTNTFIAAQEDYRTYPEKFAPFVNFARQVFIENELCLLGFSGDDPNFLHWAGWVRDHLAGHARKIYLVGALNLTAARRKHLESINIAPIDLWDAVRDIDDVDLRHKKATESFLHALAEEGQSKKEPHQWAPTSLLRSQASIDDHTRKFKDHDYAASLLKGQITTLQKDRESYPGWLICPPSLRWQLHTQLSDPFPSAQNIAALDPIDRAKLLYEIAWRHNITSDEIAPWLTEALFDIANPDNACSITKHQQIEIALILLKNSRWLVANDEAGKQTIANHIQKLKDILEKYNQYFPDLMAELAYHNAIVARDQLDYVAIESLVGTVIGEDPVWKLRRAALLVELGRFEEGKDLIAKAYGELRENYRRDPYSVPILSRLTWAHWLLKRSKILDETPEELPHFAESKYRKWNCDPWTWFESIQDQARKRQESYLKSQNPIEPLFDQGRYRDNSSNLSYSNDISEFLLLDGLSRSAGVPLRLGSAGLTIDVLASTAESLISSGGTHDEIRNYIWAIRIASSETSPSIKGAFTRIGIACASKEVIDQLIDFTLSALNYWRNQRSNGSKEQQGHSLSALRVLLETLARLVIRTSPEKAKEIFSLAISFGHNQDFQHHWLFDSFDHLLTHSLKSVPEANRGELLADALAFPSQGEVLNSNFPKWPNPVISHPFSRDKYPDINSRLNSLINLVASKSSNSATDALLRLVPLVEKENFLTPVELEKLAIAIWGNNPDYQSLPNLNVYPHVYLLLPAPDKNEVSSLINRYLYEHDENVLADTNKDLRSYPSAEIERALLIYRGMANAAANKKAELLPTPEQAINLFERLVKWRPWISGDSTWSINYEFGQRQHLKEAIADALSYAIVPALASADRNLNRYEQLQSMYHEVGEGFSLIPAFAYFADNNENIAKAVEKLIRKSLQSRNSREVGYAALALQNWATLPNAGTSISFKNLISSLIIRIESVYTSGLQQLLWALNELLKRNLLSEEQVTALVESIPNIFEATSYNNIGHHTQDAINVINASSIRVVCVKLAKRIYDQNTDNSILRNLLELSKSDTLPEVRYAIDSTEF